MTPEETYYWETLAQEARSKSLDKLHTAASNWAKALTTLLGVLALVGVTLSPTALDGRTLNVGGMEFTKLVPLLLLLMFIGLLLATWFAYAGSQAKERMVTFDPAGYRTYYLNASKDAYQQLHNFRRALFCTAAPFLLYGVISLLSTPAVNNTRLFEITTDQGLYCGKIIEDPADGQLVIRTLRGKEIKAAPATATPPADGAAPGNVILKSLTPVKACYERPLPKS